MSMMKIWIQRELLDEKELPMLIGAKNMITTLEPMVTVLQEALPKYCNYFRADGDSIATISEPMVTVLQEALPKSIADIITCIQILPISIPVVVTIFSSPRSWHEDEPVVRKMQISRKFYAFCSLHNQTTLSLVLETQFFVYRSLGMKLL